MPRDTLAAMPFDPIDLNGPCPVPSRDAWIEDADLSLPWLRYGFLLLSLDRDALADQLLDESDETAEGMNETLRSAGRNFQQLARFAHAVLERRMIGMAVLAQQVGAEG